MSQSQRGSLVEAMANTFIGYWINIAVQIVIYPLYGATFTLRQNIELGLVFLAVSLLRGYAFRRWFNGRRGDADLNQA